MKLTTLLSAITMALLISSCGKDCDVKPDLIIPKWINGEIIVKTEPGFTIAGNTWMPYGGEVTLANAHNEFYSIKRWDAYSGQMVTIYYNNYSHPFSSWDNTFLYYPQIGETITVHKCIYNQAPATLDCLFARAEPSNTEVQMVVKIENGEIVDEQEVIINTPSVRPGTYAIIDTPIIYGQTNWNYELGFQANYDLQIEESDYTNNDYINRPEDNLAGG